MSRGFLCHSDLYILKNTLDLGFESGNLKEKTFMDSFSHNTKCSVLKLSWISFADNTVKFTKVFFPLEFTAISCNSSFVHKPVHLT